MRPSEPLKRRGEECTRREAELDERVARLFGLPKRRGEATVRGYHHGQEHERSGNKQVAHGEETEDYFLLYILVHVRLWRHVVHSFA